MCFRESVLLLCAGALLAQSGSQQRPVNRFSMGDLVEDRSHGNQIVEVAGGVEGVGGYAVLIPGAGTVPVGAQNLRLVARVDGPVTCGHGPGDLVDLTLMNVKDRGLVLRAIGPFCQVKTSSRSQFTEGMRLKLVQKAASSEPAPKSGSFRAGQAVQVRSGDYWLPAVVEAFDARTDWYTVRFPNAAAQMIPSRAYAAAIVLRPPSGR